MSSNAFLSLNPSEHGLSGELCRDIELLDELLGGVLSEFAGPEFITTARRLYEEGWDKDPLKIFERYPELRDPATVERVLRAFIILFQLFNVAEQKEIVRVNRERQARAHITPRSESILETVQSLKDSGVDAERMQALLDRLDVSPTLTAHPTEARRRAVLDKLEIIANLLTENGQPADLIHLDRPLNREEHLRGELFRALNALWLTEALSLKPVTVEDEVRNAVYFIEHTIFKVVPWLRRDLREALARVYPDHRFAVPVFLRYRSWVGGDRDGNPKVTPEVTWKTLLYHKRTALTLYIRRVSELLREFTQSARLVPADQALLGSLERDREEIPVTERRTRRYEAEPYALKLLFIRTRLSATLRHLKMLKNERAVGITPKAPPHAYAHGGDFIADLELVRDSLRKSRARVLGEDGSLEDLIAQAETFGFHLAALDVRQHSGEHAAALEEIFAENRVVPDGRPYTGLGEDEKIELLTRELRNPRPLLSREWRGSDRAANVLGVFEVMRHAGRIFSTRAISSYIISMTHEVSDVLEVLVLAKEAGLLRWKPGSEESLESDIDVVPLFETIDDLERSDQLMGRVFSNESYALHLNARGRFQEIMLGYSDSSKDGGYMAANWYLHNTQERLSKLCKEREVDLRMFHGRGGTVGRGGGRAYQGIKAQPPHSLDGRVRFTEQGEVISFRYSFAPIAHRHLEQIAGAVLLTSSGRQHGGEIPAAWREAMSSMAEKSRSLYRALVYDNPDFWPFYIQATPIARISQMPIASRPVSRKGSSMVGMEDLRAIPWVFSWVQSRYLITGWYGVGGALEWFAGGDESRAALLREMYANWPFFALVIDNAQLELVRAHPQTSAWYASRVTPRETGERVHGLIEAEYERTRDWILRITGKDTLLQRSVAVRRSVGFRNPLVAPLNKLQVALMNQTPGKGKKGGTPEGEWREAMLLSIAGIAAAMQSTG